MTTDQQNLINFLNTLKKENPNYYNNSTHKEITSKRLKEKIYSSKYSNNLSYNEIDKIVDNFLNNKNEQSKPGISDDQPFFENSVAAIAGFNGNSFQNPKKKIKESLSLTNLLNEALDLSQIPDSAGNWLHKNFKNINNVYKNREELLKYLEPLDDINGVSKEWYKQFIDNVEHLYSKGPNAVLQYIYNSYLKSAGLSTKLNEQEQKDLFKKLIK
jgi:hypothetical protein